MSYDASNFYDKVTNLPPGWTLLNGDHHLPTSGTRGGYSLAGLEAVLPMWPDDEEDNTSVIYTRSPNGAAATSISLTRVAIGDLHGDDAWTDAAKALHDWGLTAFWAGGTAQSGIATKMVTVGEVSTPYYVTDTTNTTADMTTSASNAKGILVAVKYTRPSRLYLSSGVSRDAVLGPNFVYGAFYDPAAGTYTSLTAAVAGNWGEAEPVEDSDAVYVGTPFEDLEAVETASLNLPVRNNRWYTVTPGSPLTITSATSVTPGAMRAFLRKKTLRNLDTVGDVINEANAYFAAMDAKEDDKTPAYDPTAHLGGTGVLKAVHPFTGTTQTVAAVVFFLGLLLVAVAVASPSSPAASWASVLGYGVCVWGFLVILMNQGTRV